MPKTYYFPSIQKRRKKNQRAISSNKKKKEIILIKESSTPLENGVTSKEGGSPLLPFLGLDLKVHVLVGTLFSSSQKGMTLEMSLNICNYLIPHNFPHNFNHN